MGDWFSLIASNSKLPEDVVQELQERGFIVVAGPVAPGKLSQLAAVYDSAVAGADPIDVRLGGATTRVHDFVNRGPEFDQLYLHKPILGACCSVIGRPFKLSTMLARTLNPNSPAQGLHLDFPREANGWPMVGFIIMVDEFQHANGASMRRPPDVKSKPELPCPRQQKRVARPAGGRWECCPSCILLRSHDPS